VHTGVLTLFIQHTSASLLINENYDSDVLVDMEAFFARLVPDGDPLFIHTAEGVDDMPAHIRTALTQTSLSIPVINGKPTLGQWQGIFLYEHRLLAATRRVVLHLIGE
jgi:secondary thiamine-phosphate synthase enzyme